MKQEDPTYKLTYLFHKIFMEKLRVPSTGIKQRMRVDAAPTLLLRELWLDLPLP